MSGKEVTAIRIVLDITRLVEEGKLTAQEAERLQALAKRDTGSLAANPLEQAVIQNPWSSYATSLRPNEELNERLGRLGRFAGGTDPTREYGHARQFSG
jgi:hypothetical protein